MAVNSLYVIFFFVMCYLSYQAIQLLLWIVLLDGWVLLFAMIWDSQSFIKFCALSMKHRWLCILIYCTQTILLVIWNWNACLLYPLKKVWGYCIFSGPVLISLFFIGVTSTLRIHKGNRGGTLGSSPPCSCNWDTMLCM